MSVRTYRAAEEAPHKSALSKVKVHKMATTTEQSNKALVLEAFDTLFNKRNYKAAEHYWCQLKGAGLTMAPLEQG